MKEKQLSPKDFKYGLIAYTRTEEDMKRGMATVLHFCGYTCFPTDEDINSLIKELNTDPEFNLVGRLGKDVFVMPASPEQVEFYTSKAEKIKVHKNE